MIYLLNLVKECEKRYKEKNNKSELIVFDVFLEVVKERKLINPEKIAKLLNEHETSMEKKRKSLMSSF